jgi:hypothetical protein
VPVNAWKFHNQVPELSLKNNDTFGLFLSIKIQIHVIAHLSLWGFSVSTPGFLKAFGSIFFLVP